jgi:formate hydrogenlyase subunit 6/NADH:ubiquinone oxidoreductase subunit I
VEAIRMGRDYELAVYRKEDLIMETEALQCETDVRPSAGSGRR